MPSPQVDRLTITGLGLLLAPALTMWHEIGGHVGACLLQGGHVSALGAFYVECDPLGTAGDIVVALAGVAVNMLLSLIAWRLWRSARSDTGRLIWWLVWVSEAFVAAGYFCFSGVTGFGDLGTAAGGSLRMLPAPLAWRVGEAAIGIAAYVWLVRAAMAGLTQMLGHGVATASARRTIAHGYYATAGAVSLLVGLMNPVGIVITLLSAVASSFGGLAGFISIGFAVPRQGEARAFTIRRQWPMLIGGALVALAFAAVLGRSLRF